MTRITISRAADIPVQEHAWGSLTWFANAALGNAQGLTVGRCILKPGQRNPPHRHRGHGEVLIVLAGTIRHTGPDATLCDLGPGDVLSIPDGVPHQAENLGDTDAVLLVAYPVPERDVIGE